MNVTKYKRRACGALAALLMLSGTSCSITWREDSQATADESTTRPDTDRVPDTESETETTPETETESVTVPEPETEPETETETEAVTEPHVHEYGEWTVTVEATCKKKGEKARACACGEQETAGIAPLGHAMGEWYKTKAPTESEAGEKRRDCSNCDRFEKLPIQPLSHSHDRWGTVILPAVDPTCTTNGLTVGSKCSGCGDVTWAQSTIPATGHAMGAWYETKAPTETDDGEKRCDCANCDYYETEPAVVNFEITQENRSKIGYTGAEGENLVIPAVFQDGGAWYRVTSIGSSAFYECTGLTSATIGDSVTSIGSSAFYECTGLTSVTIGDSVTSIGNYAFYYCTGLTSITIPNSVTSISRGAFYNCTGLTGITIPASVTSIGSYAFYNCSGLTDVYYTGTASQWNAISKGSGWDDYTPDYTVHFSGEPTYSQGLAYTLKADGTYEVSGIGTSTDTDVVIPAEYEGKAVTSIGSSAFYECTGLTSITIPNSVTGIGSSAFYNCSGLTSITIPDSVTSIGEWAFYNCYRLTSITIPDGVTSIGSSAFLECTGLTDITIPDSVTSIGDEAFRFCDSLTSVTIPDSVTSIGRSAFYSCSGLTSITIPDSVTSIGDGAFSWCSGLTEIYVASGNPVYVSQDGVLYDRNMTTLICCPGGKSTVTIPDSVTSIGEWAFFGCSGLTNITIPDSVTSIGNSTFSECHGLTSITIPDSVTSIGERAFYYCTGLTSIYYTGTEAEWNAISKGSGWDDYTPDYTIHYNYTPV